MPGGDAAAGTVIELVVSSQLAVPTSRTNALGGKDAAAENVLPSFDVVEAKVASTTDVPRPVASAARSRRRNARARSLDGGWAERAELFSAVCRRARFISPRHRRPRARD